MVNDLIHNYKIKLNDLQGGLRREKFTITVGDELPGNFEIISIYCLKRKLKVRDKMAGRHGNKVLLQESFVMKICLSLKTERQLILC
jgi:DNA-directed RNA polymerase subunit beta